MTMSPGDMVIHNVRKHSHFDLNTTGFKFLKHNTSLTREDFDSIDVVGHRYYAEVDNFVQKNHPLYSAVAFVEYEVYDLPRVF